LRSTARSSLNCRQPLSASCALWPTVSTFLPRRLVPSGPAAHKRSLRFCTTGIGLAGYILPLNRDARLGSGNCCIAQAIILSRGVRGRRLAMARTGAVLGGRLANRFCLLIFHQKGKHREEIAACRFSVGGRLGRVRKTCASAAAPTGSGCCSGARSGTRSSYGRWQCRPGCARRRTGRNEEGRKEVKEVNGTTLQTKRACICRPFLFCVEKAVAAATVRKRAVASATAP